MSVLLGKFFWRRGRGETSRTPQVSVADARKQIAQDQDAQSRRDVAQHFRPTAVRYPKSTAHCPRPPVHLLRVERELAASIPDLLTKIGAGACKKTVAV